MAEKPELKLEHSDERGEIYSIELPDGHEILLLHSVAGSLRGGHAHSCDEVVLLLSGKMRYYKKNGRQEWEFIVDKDGAKCFNGREVIHLAEFLENSWVLEYKVAKKGQWVQWNYPPYREKVEKSLGSSSTKTLHQG